MGLASITANDTSHGRGWNPDAAMIMAVNDVMKGRPAKRRYCLIHISDCEFCKSLARSDLTNALEEVEVAARRIINEGTHTSWRVSERTKTLFTIGHPARVPILSRWNPE